MTAAERVDCVVIGAGVVGLATARALALAGREVLILEAGRRFGMGISSRSSEVVHAGLYYAPGSLKARLCVRGRALLYDYCAARGIAHRRCGKLVVATRAGQEEALGALAQRGHANGVDDLRLLSAGAAQRLEPSLACTAALLSPSTGIVDSHALMLTLLGDAENAGALLAVDTPVAGGAVCRADGTILLETGGAAPLRLAAATVVNAAGLGATAVAAALRGLPPAAQPAMRMAKGSYFRLAARAPFAHLVYPLPEPGGLGVHLTLDLAGQVRFGPDVEWLPAAAPEPDYRVEPARAARFYAEIRRYWPDLPDGALAPDYAGVRPKLGDPDEPPTDFRINGPAQHGVAGLVNLFGIESPGLTSALAIGEHVAALLGGA